MKANILLILHLPPPIHGAAMVGKYIQESRLINSKFNCRYINLTTATDLEDIGILGFNKIKRIFLLIKKIYNVLKKEKFDFVYITPNAKGSAFYKDFIIIQLLKIMKCKIITHYHNKGVSLNENKRLDNFLYQIYFKNLQIILLAETLFLDIKKYVSEENIYICPNGIPDTSTTEYIKQTNDTYPQILFLSNMLVDKGVYILLDALKILKDKDLSFHCKFVGSETAEINSYTFLHEVEKRNLNNEVVFLGKRYGEEKNKLLENSDIFILPTLNECFPLVLLEAMQYRLACIASNEGGIQDIISDKETGFIIEKNNPQKLAEKIEILIKDRDLCKEMGNKGYFKYKKEFTLNKFESNLSLIFENYHKKIKQNEITFKRT